MLLSCRQWCTVSTAEGSASLRRSSVEGEGDDVWLPTRTTCGLLARKLWTYLHKEESKVTQLRDQPGGHYGAECWTVIHKKHSHIVPPPVVDVGEFYGAWGLRRHLWICLYNKCTNCTPASVSRYYFIYSSYKDGWDFHTMFYFYVFDTSSHTESPPWCPMLDPYSSFTLISVIAYLHHSNPHSFQLQLLQTPEVHSLWKLIKYFCGVLLALHNLRAFCKYTASHVYTTFQTLRNPKLHHH